MEGLAAFQGIPLWKVLRRFDFQGQQRALHLRACALKPFSLHFFNPSFGLANLDGRLLMLPVDTVTTCQQCSESSNSSPYSGP